MQFFQRLEYQNLLPFRDLVTPALLYLVSILSQMVRLLSIEVRYK